MDVNDLSPESALRLIKRFLISDWKSVTPEDVKITKLKGGYCNSIWLIQSRCPDAKSASLGYLVIRLSGGNIVDLEDVTFNTNTTCKVIAFEMSKRSLGPRLYGVTPSGSIEEYIFGRTLTWKDATNEKISKNFANALARVHSIKGIPLRQDSFEVMMKRMKKNAKKFSFNTHALTKHECLSRYSVDVNPMVEFDFDAEAKWLQYITTTHALRKNFILLDMNYLNCLVRETQNRGDANLGDANLGDTNSGVVLIDYDLAQYNFRGIDLGAHFFFRVFEWDNPVSKIVKCAKFPTLNERRQFLSVYQQETKRLRAWENFDENGVDSVENLLIESLIGQLIHMSFFCAWFLSKCDQFLSFDPSFLEVNALRVSTYREIKKELISLVGDRFIIPPESFEVKNIDSTSNEDGASFDLSAVESDLDAKIALEIIKPFFPKEWSRARAEDVTISVLKGGLCSSIWRVTRTDANKIIGDANFSDAKKEPRTLLIKKKGGNSVNVDDFGFNHQDAIKILTNEISTRGLGPKLYGLIKGGSIEEYIESHTLTANESADPIISKDIAISLARMHAITGVPLERDAYEYMMEKVTEFNQIFSSKKHLLGNANLSASDIEEVLAFDFEEEKFWLLGVVPKFRMRKNLILLDMGYLNCLVRETPKDETPKEETLKEEANKSSVVLIDYDLAQYNFRGLDLGAHFFSRIFAGGENSAEKTYKFNSNVALPSVEEKKRFLKHYQEEIKHLELWDDFDENGVDSVENLLIESIIGNLISNLFFSTFCLSKVDIFMNSDAPFIHFIPFCLRYQMELKEEIMKLLERRT